VTNVVHPAETRSGSCRYVHLGQNNLEVSLVHQISVTVNYGSDTLVEISLAVKGNLDGLHCKVRVALVKNLPESNLGITGNIDILSAIRH